MDAPRVNNKSEFVGLPFLLLGKEGEELAVIVKATFLCLAGTNSLELAPVDSQRGIRAVDVPWGDPEKSSIKYPSDLCLKKPGTDVIVVACAYAPQGKAVPSFDAGVRVGALQKLVRIFGPRVWETKGSALSAPRPTMGIEVRYDYAWGGLDATDPLRIIEEPRNPVGMGVVRDLSLLTHKAAPFIEDLEVPLRSINTRPPPAGLGTIGRSWVPRRGYFGTYDKAWFDERAPLLPRDQDERANLCASPGLVAVPPLRGNEDVALLNLTPGGGTLSFRLPNIRVEVCLKVHGRTPEVLVPYLDTVIIDTLAPPEKTQVVVELVWRAVFRAPRRMKDADITIVEKEAA
jgi:hypothetical protein